MIQPGDTQHILHNAYFHVKTGTPVGEIDFPHYYRKWLDLKATQGWKFERMLNVWRTPGVVISKHGFLADEWQFRAVLSRQATRVTLNLPDTVIGRLLKNPRFTVS
jgi:hypothetical protein